ncbi:kelch domain-containing protein 1-like isoform X2 [Homalodisca vitripennis]|uniref:Kelch domain-containing protein n=1 Tax=Homalodisca liturata TaxID=320908 RepID=A0A1B6I797_9HEMI|nr:kelch domain-containing protein 1-like isoform X2 [Homalodisca vitripennis]
MSGITLNDRIHRRSGHVAVPYKNCMLVWGGYMEQMLDADVEIAYSTYHPTDEIWVYNCLTEVWCRVLTKGDIPPKVSGCCALLHGDDLYTFGGYQHKSETGTTNHLYRLNLKTLEWKRLFPMGDWPVCCDKMAGWVYQDKLYFFGGFGPVGRCRNEFQIVLEPTSELSPWPTGWNNQLAVYNIELDCWEWPRCRGSIPAPRAAHAAAISENRVYVFGGRLRLIRNNELHCLDLDTMTWSGNLTDASKSECGVPEGRTWHTLTFISPDKAVLYGGLSQYNAVLSDCWMLDVAQCGARWCKRSDCRPLLWHRAIHSQDTGELLIQGGLKRSIVAAVTWRDHAYELLVLPFAPKSLFRLCLDVVCQNNQFLKSEYPTLPVNLQSIISARLNNPS